MDQQHLYKHSKSYAVLKKYTAFVQSLYYREICIIHRGNIPVNDPVIFAPNHQNALMDALSILLNIDKQPVFMARADIFKKEMVKKLLTFLKIIPVFRIRDGIDNLSQNDETFTIALNVLKKGQAVGMMPEGNHGEQHRLRPLKKGISRLAFKAQEDFGDTAKLKIVPVGVEYSHYSNFRSRLLIIFGTPIDVSEYASLYKENPQQAMNILREKLAGELKKYMLDIDTDEYYDLIFRIKELYGARLQQKQNQNPDFYGRFLADKQITDKLVKTAYHDPLVLEDLKPLVNEYMNGLKRLNLRDWVFDTPKPTKKEIGFDVVRYLLFLPIFAAATAVNIIPYLVCDLYSKRIKDPQFVSSFKFAIGLFLFPLWYLFILVLPIPLITKALIILVMPMLGILSFDYFLSLKKLYAKFRYFRMKKDNNHDLAAVRNKRDELFQKLDGLFNQ
jgi:1-acyl-sn-glycerol-3-phosphate acyltransferase